MQQIDRQREMDSNDIKQIWYQLAFGTVITLAGIILVGIVELVGRFLETL